MVKRSRLKRKMPAKKTSRMVLIPREKHYEVFINGKYVGYVYPTEHSEFLRGEITWSKDQGSKKAQKEKKKE